MQSLRESQAQSIARGRPITMRRSLTAILAVVVFAWFGLEGPAAQTRTAVSPDFIFIQQFDQEQLSQTQCYSLGTLRAGDVVSLRLRSSRNTRLRFQLVEGPSCDVGPITFGLPDTPYQLQHDGPAMLVIDSSSWLPWAENRIVGDIVISRKHTPADLATAGAMVRSFATYVDARFVTRPFIISYRPCGTINAYTDLATGNITLCTELINSAISPNLQWAIFLHELGHSLLSGWGERGGERESDCDDFAAALLVKEDGGIGAVQEFVQYFANNKNTWIDQFAQIANGDPHPPNIQRANLLSGSLYGNANDFVRGWDRTLYPHMKTDWLKQVWSRNFESRDLIAEQLKRR